MNKISRDKIRKYITKQLGRDPQDNFDVLKVTKTELTIRVKYSKRDEDNLVITIPNK